MIILIIIIIIIIIICFFKLLLIINSYNYSETNKNNSTYIDCRASTIDNPMQNILFNNLNLSPCQVNEKDKLDKLKYNFYYNEKDIFNTKNNIRNIISTPSNIYPNNINNYISYLYNFNNPICKTDNINCIATYRNIKYS